MTIKFLDPNYLLNSGKVDERLIFADDHNNFYNAILDDNASPKQKEIILKFLIPNKISSIKTKYNGEAIKRYLNNEVFDADIVAPSLLLFFEDNFNFQSDIPDWFFSAFPDVAWWILKKDGIYFAEAIESRFQKSSPDHTMLEAYIDFYSANVSALECATYKHLKETQRIELKEYYEDLIKLWQPKSEEKLQASLENFDSRSIIYELTENTEAFTYLSGRFIREDICHFCGEYPIDGYLRHTVELNNFKISSCEDCFNREKNKINKERLINYYEHLFLILNNNGYKRKNKFENIEYNYTVETEELGLNHTALTENLYAFYYLKENSHIKENICHLCGEHSIDNSFTFREPFNNIKVNICEKCHINGRQRQGREGNIPKPKSGCLVILTAVFLTTFIILIL